MAQWTKVLAVQDWWAEFESQNSRSGTKLLHRVVLWLPAPTRTLHSHTTILEVSKQVHIRRLRNSEHLPYARQLHYIPFECHLAELTSSSYSHFDEG